MVANEVPGEEKNYEIKGHDRIFTYLKLNQNHTVSIGSGKDGNLDI